jgi:hypothetical protein
MSSTSKILISCCAASSALFSGYALADDDETLLLMSDLNYVGAFRITYVSQDEGKLGFAQGRIAVSSDTNSFFIAGNPNEAIAEYSIPEIVNSTDLDELNFTGEPLQNFVDFSEKASYTTDNNNIRNVAGMEVMDGKLIVTVYDAYDAASSLGFDVDNLFIVEDAYDLANSKVTGYIEMEDNMFAAGWLSPIPTNLQSELGADYITGSARMASIDGRWSMGPSAYSVDSDTLLSTSAGGTVPNTALLKYPLFNRMWWQMDGVNQWNYDDEEDNANCPSFVDDNDLWSADCVQDNDLWTELSRAHYGVIVPGTKTYLTLGSSAGHQTGSAYKNSPVGYGTACSGGCPYDWTDQDNRIWMFDVDDLIAHKNGESESYDAVPYEYGTIDYPFDDTDGDGTISKVIGADYDSASNLLYIVLDKADEEQAYEAAPLVLVYEIELNRPKPPVIMSE